jgi:flagellar basal-body rod protein FlgB
LANLETPHYRRVDVSPKFTEELQQALASRDPARIASVQPEMAPDLNAVAHRKDGNTVELETELLKLNQNFMEHQLGTQLVTGALLKLRLAITGRGS